MNANDVVLWILVAVVAFILGSGQRGAITGTHAQIELPVIRRAAQEDARLLAYRTWVVGLLERFFSLEDLRTLAFDVGIEWDELPEAESGKPSRARELLVYCERRGMVGALLDGLRLRRA